MYLLLGFEIEHFPEFPSDVEFCNGKLLRCLVLGESMLTRVPC